jgi:nucleotide-binding universal stress UspA family protein
MKKVDKILAPTDLSELSRVGLEYALELARGWGAEVTVYLGRPQPTLSPRRKIKGVI